MTLISVKDRLNYHAITIIYLNLETNEADETFALLH